MKLWAVPPPSMFLLFKTKRKLRRGKTTRTEMCLVVSVAGLHLSPASWMFGEVYLGALSFHKIQRETHVKINHCDSAVGPCKG